MIQNLDGRRAIALALSSLALVSACEMESPDLAPEENEPVAAEQDSLELALFHSCSPSQKREMRAAERLAKYILQPHIVQEITSFKDANHRPHWIVDQYFDDDGVWDRETADHVRTRMKEIHERIADGDVVVRCREILRCNDAVAHVIPPFQDKLTFCPAYFGRDPYYQAAVWAHELSHELFLTTDRVYERDTPSDVWSLNSRKNRYYQEVNSFANRDHLLDAGEQYEAFTWALIGEYFDNLYKEHHGRAITRAEMEQAIDDIHHDREPLARIIPRTPVCPEGATERRSCPSGYSGAGITRECVGGRWIERRVCARSGGGGGGGSGPVEP